MKDDLVNLSDPTYPAQQRPLPSVTLGAGRFLAGTFEDDTAIRDYKLYVPNSEGQTLPLVVMLHCTQDPDNFATGTKINLCADEETRRLR